MAKGRRKQKKIEPKVERSIAADASDLRPKALRGLVSNAGSHAKPVFSFALADRSQDGEWGWHLLDDAHELVNLLLDWGKKTWDEIRSETAGRRRRHHWQPVASLCTDAQRRLERLELDDMGDDIFRFRHGGTKRLWGFEVDGIFHALWWDPNHRVYPTEPD